MTERIVKIEEFIGNDDAFDDDDYGYSGYKIHTDKQVISLLISNGQSCCEDWGYLMSEELNDGDNFIGANITSIKEVSLADITKDEDEDDYFDPCIFINVNTDRGTLQFKAYNSHNGYYGHDVRVHSEQLKLKETL